MRRSFRVAAVALSLLGAPAPLAAAAAAEPAPPETFAEGALTAGRIQAALARLASHRASDPAVRRFAAALARDLDARNERLARLLYAVGVRSATDTLADRSGPEPPRRPPEFHRLRIRAGAALDKQFLRATIIGHENALRGYAAETESTDDEVRGLAAEAVPRLKQDLAEARRLLERLERRPR